MADSIKDLKETLTQLSGTDTDLKNILQSVLKLFTNEFGAQRGCLLLEDSCNKEIVVTEGCDLQQEKFPFSRKVVDTVLDLGVPMVCFDAGSDHALSSRQSIKVNGTRSVMCVPLQHKGVTKGILYLDSTLDKGIFSPNQIPKAMEACQILMENLYPL